MDSYLFSDLHIGIDEPESLFAGGTVLPRLLADLVAQPMPVRIILNGDTFDFLLAEGEPLLDAGCASAAARRLVRSDLGAAVLRQLGRLLAKGGEVWIRLGNHDLELALPAVQAVIRTGLAQPAGVAARLRFATGERPMLLDVGGARVLITHGEHDDPFNRIDYDKLLPCAAAAPRTGSAFEYPAGSLLMRKIVSPLRRKYDLRFLDFLKPDFQGAVLVGLAVAPQACRELFQGAAWDIGWQLLGRGGADMAFAAGAAQQPELGLAARIDDSALSPAEQNELGDFVAETEDGVSFAPGGLSQQLRAKLLRAGLSLYARAHRALAGRAGDDFFRIEPGAAEVDWAAALGRRHGADAVLTGHTHAARFSHAAGKVYINSGTWIWLMRLPPADAALSVWIDFLDELRHNPMLAPERQRLARTERLLTVVTARPLARGGARLTLSVCEDDGTLRELHAAELPASEPAAWADGQTPEGGSHV